MVLTTSADTMYIRRSVAQLVYKQFPVINNISNYFNLQSTTIINMSKRKMPRRELPFISTLLDKLPYSKLPTNGVVLRRLMFEIQENHGSAGGLSAASVTVMEELRQVWEYAGYEDILQTNCNIARKIVTLHVSYTKLMKIPISRRQTESFKKKEESFTKSLDLLFDVTVKSLHGSGLITAEDREFLLHHWDKTVSSTRDNATKIQVEKRLAREESYRRYSSANSTPLISSTPCIVDLRAAVECAAL